MNFEVTSHLQEWKNEKLIDNEGVNLISRW